MSLFKQNIDKQIEEQKLNEEDSYDISELDKQEEYKNRKLKHQAIRWIYISALCLCGICLIIYLWHIFAPYSWRWLLDNEIQTIKSFAISISTGVIASFASNFLIKK